MEKSETASLTETDRMRQRDGLTGKGVEVPQAVFSAV